MDALNPGNEQTMTKSALIFDDDPEQRDFLSAILAKDGFDVQSVGTFSSFKEIATACGAELIVLDLSLDDTDGVEVLGFLSNIGCKSGVMLVSSFEERLINTALNVGSSYGLSMVGTLRKPVRPAAMRELLKDLPEATPDLQSHDIEDAISKDYLFLNYQPKVDLETGVVLSAEALVRWNDPVRGFIFPDQFIGLAEQSGLIEPMTEKILARAIKECREWQDRGHDIAVAVNISATTLANLDFPNQVSRYLSEAGLPASKLILEVTETTAMTDTKATMNVLTRLRIKGISVSLDDFGTGFSSLVELHRMPFSELKIDRSFVMNVDRDKDSRIIVEAILGLAHALDLKVVAEGVEKEAHWNLLRDLKCNMAQGYYLSKPAPPAEFLNWVSEWNSRSGL